jgi:hypothetical protein
MSNREVSSLIWLVVILILFIVKSKDVRTSLYRLLNIAFKIKLLFLWGLIFFYSLAVTYLLYYIGYWKFDLLVGTISWVLFVAIHAIFKLSDIKKEKFFIQFVLNELRAILLFEFIINTYTFNIGIELLLVPFVTILSMLDIYGEYYKDFQQISKVSKNILCVVGFVIMANAFYKAYYDISNIASYTTLKSVMLPFVYSIFFSPFLYLLSVFFLYESIVTRFKIMGNKKTSFEIFLQTFKNCKLSRTKLLKFYKVNREVNEVNRGSK